MLADPSYGGNKNMGGWRYVGFPGNPMRGGADYAKWIFNSKPYPFQYKPAPMPQDMKGAM
jgi:gluconate 2-dehydrogenase gamma chain